MAQPSALPDAARAAILAWWEVDGRRLAIRGTSDPYAILVSEAMAQQTQIARASDRWTRFLDRYPTVAALAQASPADVLREWRGLGYNRRALNLWRAARLIVDEHDGRVPDDPAILERLPGVGPYTARAVAAIAFGRPVGAVDTNVRRVLGRASGIPMDSVSAPLQRLADDVVPPDRAGDWTHALMDVGAAFCRPVRPRCGPCPVRPWCAWVAAPVAVIPADAAGARPRPRAPAFALTSRWLRGRLLDAVRDEPGDDWVSVTAPVGAHDAGAVERALAALARDGLIERHPHDPTRCRLPLR